LRHEPDSHNRQLCLLSAISLAPSFVLYRYTVPFLCIMCHRLRCNVSETAALLTHNCWWNIFYVCVSITTLMHNSFILQQYTCYIIIIDMFQLELCSSSGGQIVLLQHLVSSLSINGHKVHRLRADCMAIYWERPYQMLQ
jgi:hypothetical protein